MTVTVRLFAVLRERVGSDSIEVELEDGATVAEALARLAERPELGELLDRMPVAMAVNRDYADPGTSLAAGDELALVPPVSGGSGDANVHARVTDDPLSLEPFQADHRKLFHGKAMLILRAGEGQGGNIKITAESDGLKPATATVMAKPIE